MRKRQRIIRTIVVVLMLLSLLMGLLPMVFADNDSTEADLNDERFVDKTWDEVIADFFESHDIDGESGNITLGYCNTVTGEEHYFLPDQYMLAASMYKIPMNMYYAEKVYNGEITMDTTYSGITYEKLQNGTIVYSNNDYAKILWDAFGYSDGNSPYRNYRRAIAPIMGEDPDTVDDKFYENNYSTARQQLHALKLLAANPERYPGVIDCMLKAERSKYMLYHTQSVEVAHKYGYATDDHDFKLYINDCAICYTDEPIVIVMYCSGLKTENMYYHNLADYCTLMIDYAQYHTALDKQEKAMATPEPTPVVTPEPTPIPTPAPTPEPIQTVEESDIISEENVRISNMQLMILVAIFALFMLSILLINIEKLKIKLVPAFLAVIFAAGALIACIYGASAGEAKLAPEGNPGDTTEKFFAALVSGDSSEACTYLKDYSDLGLNFSSEDTETQALYDALKASWDYSIVGEPVVTNAKAVQYIDFTYLDLKAFTEGLREETEAILEETVKNAENPNVLYDKDNNYLPEVANEAYSAALNKRFSLVNSFYTVKRLKINSEYDYNTKQWYITADNDLFNALSGNIAY